MMYIKAHSLLIILLLINTSIALPTETTDVEAGSISGQSAPQPPTHSPAEPPVDLLAERPTPLQLVSIVDISTPINNAMRLPGLQGSLPSGFEVFLMQEQRAIRNTVTKDIWLYDSRDERFKSTTVYQSGIRIVDNPNVLILTDNSIYEFTPSNDFYTFENGRRSEQKTINPEITPQNILRLYNDVDTATRETEQVTLPLAEELDRRAREDQTRQRMSDLQTRASTTRDELSTLRGTDGIQALDVVTELAELEEQLRQMEEQISREGIPDAERSELQQRKTALEQNFREASSQRSNLLAARNSARGALNAYRNSLEQQQSQETEEDKKIDLGIQIQIINRDISVINQQEREENLRHLELKLRIANQRLEQVTENFEQEGKTEEQIKNDASVQQLTRLIAGFESATEQEETAYESHRTEAAEARQQAEILKFEKNNYFLRSVAVMTALLKGYREFSGLAQLSSLFINDEELDKRRNQIDEQFCESILFGGTKCWTSKICDGYIDTTPQGSTLITKGPSKTPFGFVHLEAEKSLPMHTVQEGRKTTLFQYKVTYSITNPLDKPMFYNLEFASTDKTVKIFTEDKIIEKETFDGKLGSDALIPPLSKTDYTSICLTWTPAITSFDGKRETRFCVPISQYEGAATKPYGQTTTVPVTGKQVTIQGFRYSPNIITIDEGESITWTNQDDTGHTVTIMQGPETFDSGEIAPGQQFSYTFTKPGTYSYECSIHTAMKGSIRVNPEAVRPTTPTPEKKEDFRNF